MASEIIERITSASDRPSGTTIIVLNSNTICFGILNTILGIPGFADQGIFFFSFPITVSIRSP